MSAGSKAYAVVRPSLSRAGAEAVLARTLAAAEREEVAVVVWVVDVAGHDLALTVMDGSPLLSRQVAADKAWTAIAFGQPTDWWSDLLADQPALSALARNNRLMAVPGGVPLRLDGEVVGGLGVSGGTAEEDARIAAAGAAALT